MKLSLKKKTTILAAIILGIIAIGGGIALLILIEDNILGSLSITGGITGTIANIAIVIYGYIEQKRTIRNQYLKVLNDFYNDLKNANVESLEAIKRFIADKEVLVEDIRTKNKRFQTYIDDLDKLESEFPFRNTITNCENELESPRGLKSKTNTIIHYAQEYYQKYGENFTAMESTYYAKIREALMKVIELHRKIILKENINGIQPED